MSNMQKPTATRPDYAAQAEAVKRITEFLASQNGTANAALSAAATTLAAVPAMVEALQPFADIAEAIDAGHEPRMLRADDSPIWSANVFQVGPLDITMRKLRAARTILRRLGGERG
jgi:hypothetical protein